MKKIHLLIIIILVLPLFLTGCYDSESIEKYYYAIALGIDKSETSNIKLSVQVATIESSGNSSSQSTQSSIYSADCENLNIGLNIINNYISKKISLSHCSAIIFSEEIAKEGIGEYVNTLVNNSEIRPTAKVLISNKKASDILENVTESGENFSSRFYEFIINSVDYTGYSTKSELGRLFYNINSNYESATANYLLIDNKIVQSFGIAVFNSDKLKGHLSPIQSLAHLIITDQLNESTVSISNPLNNSNGSIEFLITKNKPTITDISILNDTPYLNTKIKLNAKIQSANLNFDYTNPKNLAIIKNEFNNYIKNIIDDYYYQIIKVYNVDIGNLCDQISSKYLTIDDFKKINWKENYKNTFYTTEVDSTITTSLFTKE